MLYALLADDTPRTVLERLDPPTRAAVLMALLAMLVLGLGLVALTMLGGHWVRRLGPRRPAARGPVNRPPSAGAAAPRGARLPEGPLGETVVLTPRPDDTVADGA